MQIVKVELNKVALPMREPFVTAFGTIDKKEVVIVTLHTADGLVGYGESSTLSDPSYTAETVETCLLVQEHFLAPTVLGKSFDTVEAFVDAYKAVAGNNIAKTGFECAFWHLIAQRDNTSLQSLFGGTKPAIAVGEGIGIKDTVEQTLAAVQKHLDEGYVRIKVKIKPGWDFEPLSAIRERFPDITLTADGNSAYNMPEALSALQAIDDLGLSMIEQPLAHDDLVGHAALAKALKTPICLDESVESANDAASALALKSCSIINIKPGRVGGILEAIRIHDLAAEHGVGVWCGGLLETGIGRAFNIALASKENFIYPADMSPYTAYFQDDITDPPLMLKEGTITVPTSPGLGYTVRQQALDRYTTKHLEITYKA